MDKKDTKSDFVELVRYFEQQELVALLVDLIDKGEIGEIVMKEILKRHA